jgi:hypothetical protein
MCFSATASFVTAGVTAAAGLAALSRIAAPREILLAATPLLFALQQSVEGALWLTLPVAPDGAASSALTLAFLLLAEAFWPVYAPLSVLLIEPNGMRRRLMGLGLAVGVGVAAYLFWSLLVRSHGAVILGGHIVYASDYPHSDTIGAAYLAATALSLLVSSQRAVIALGAIVLLGSLTAYAFYWEAFVSVWCFFAASASLVILGHFEWARRRLRLAGA